MTFQEAIEFANEIGGCYLATADGDQPRVRGMRMWYADETGFYYHTGTGKRLADQLFANKKVEAIFHDPGSDPTLPGRTMRVTGAVEIMEDAALEERLLEERSWLKAVFAAYPDDRLVIFRIAHGTVQPWDMSINNREKTIPPLEF